MTAHDLIKKHEGLELFPYRCSANKLSLGYGRNLDDVGITISEAEMLLDNDISKCRQQLSAMNLSTKLNDARYAAVIDMIYNLGFAGFLKFTRMIYALESRDFKTAAREMLDSKWATQVGSRADELAEIIKTGNLE